LHKKNRAERFSRPAPECRKGSLILFGFSVCAADQESGKERFPFITKIRAESISPPCHSEMNGQENRSARIFSVLPKERAFFITVYKTKRS
jgi:hypothetical protein